MAEAQRLIGISLAKIAQSRVCRGGVSLHKNLLVATVLQKARYIFMEEAYHIVHGHYLQQQQQQQHHHQLMQEQQNAAYLLAGHCDSSSADSCDEDCSTGGGKCSAMEEKQSSNRLPTIGGPTTAAQEDELVDPVEEGEEDEDETTSLTVSGGAARDGLSYDSDSTILPTTIGGLPLEPLNMCRNSGACTAEEDQDETGAVGEEEGKESTAPHDVSHLFLLPALAPWISASEDKENAGGSFPFLPSAFDSHEDEDEEEEEQEEEEEEEEEEENTCQDLSCHQRKPAVVETEQTPELVKQFESAVRSKGAMRYFDLDDRRATIGRPDRRRRRHRTEGDHHHHHQSAPIPAKRRRSSTTESSANDIPTTGSSRPPVEEERLLPIALLSAKRLKTCDSQRSSPHPSAICGGSTGSGTGQPQFYSSPHETICPGDAETLSECVNQQLEAENLTTTSGSQFQAGTEQSEQQQQQHPAEESPDVDAPPTPSVESIDRITSLVSIFSFGNLSRSVSTPDFCAAQAQKDSRPDAGGSLLTSQLQHHGQRGYLTMTV